MMVPDADALVEFMSHAFGAEEVFRTRGARRAHVEVRVGDSMVMIGGLQEESRSQRRSSCTWMAWTRCSGTALEKLERPR